MILERLLAAVSVLLLIGCMIAPLKKTAFAQRNPWVKKLLDATHCMEWFFWLRLLSMESWRGISREW